MMEDGRASGKSVQLCTFLKWNFGPAIGHRTGKRNGKELVIQVIKTADIKPAVNDEMNMRKQLRTLRAEMRPTPEFIQAVFLLITGCNRNYRLPIEL